VVAAPSRVREVLAARITADLAGSLISQALVRHLLERVPELAAGLRTELAGNQRALNDALVTHLPTWESDNPAAGAWRWIRLPADARELTAAARIQGVLVTAGPLFSAEGRLGDRIRVAAVEPPAVLIEGVRRLRSAWDCIAHEPGSASDGRDLLFV
jgi:DNA-binding transcriptional MocR family regulator